MCFDSSSIETLPCSRHHLVSHEARKKVNYESETQPIHMIIEKVCGLGDSTFCDFQPRSLFRSSFLLNL